MKRLWQEFKKFIKRGNVVDMAVGVAVATAFTKIVNAFTAGFISPLIALISGNTDLANLKTVIIPEIMDAEGAVVQAEVAILWGAFIQTVIDFLIIALVMFTVLQVVAALNKRAERIAKQMRDRLVPEEEAARLAAEAEAAKAKAEADAKAAEEARLAAEAEAAKVKAEEERLLRQEQILSDIRDLLREKK
jgi:large conductance mechanosensitive channel